jgi:hypothetical protein
MTRNQLEELANDIPLYAAFFRVTKPYSAMKAGDLVYMWKTDSTTVIHYETKTRAYVKVSCLNFIDYARMNTKTWRRRLDK